MCVVICVASLWLLCYVDFGDDEVFVDRDPDLFPYILQWLRDGENAILPLTEVEQRKLKQEANFYGYSALESYIERQWVDRITVTLETAEFDCVTHVDRKTDEIAGNPCSCGMDKFPGNQRNDIESSDFAPPKGHPQPLLFTRFNATLSSRTDTDRTWDTDRTARDGRACTGPDGRTTLAGTDV